MKFSDFLIVLASLFLFFLLGEIFMRFLEPRFLFYDVEMARYANELKQDAGDPAIGHVHRPRAQAILTGVPIKINEDGFRDDDYSTQRNQKYRIIFLGDSLTLGWGVQKEDTFEELLEKKLSERYPTEIINFGTGNYNTGQEINLFMKKGLKYQPNKVVLFYFINDAEPLPKKSHWGFLGRSYLVTFYWSRTQALFSRFFPSRSYDSYYRGLYRPGQPGWLLAKEALLELKNVCDDKGMTLQVVLLPDFHQLQDYPFRKEHEQVKSFLDEHQISNLDLAAFFKDEAVPTRLWVARDDAHPNAAAHRLIAQFSLDFLAQSLPAAS